MNRKIHITVLYVLIAILTIGNIVGWSAAAVFKGAVEQLHQQNNPHP